MRDLAVPTVEALHEYARFMITSADAPSASWNTPVNELCRAVEFEIVNTLGDMPKLAQLNEDMALGEMAHLLRDLGKNESANAATRAHGLDPDFVFMRLPSKLSKLAGIRRQSGAVHGRKVVRHATQRHAQSALKTAISGKSAIIPDLVCIRRNPVQMGAVGE